MSIFYLIFIALTTYFSFRYDRIEEYDSHKQHRLWLMCVYLICLSGFSYGLGGDKFIYMEEFDKYPDNFSDAGNEIWLSFMGRGQMPLWTAANLACKSLFHSFYAVQILESAAINLTVCYLVSKYTHRYFLFLLIYFFSLQYFIFNTEVMREAFAMSFVLMGFHAYVNNNKKLYFVSIVIGVLFHVSAVIAVLFLFARFPISWKTLLKAFVISFAIWLFSDLILTKFVETVFGGKGALVTKVLFYSIQASNIFGFLRNVITYLIFPFVIMYTSLQSKKMPEQRQQLEKFTAFMVILGVITGAIPGLTRIYNYVQIMYLIALADFIYITFRDKKHFIPNIGVITGTVFFISLTYLMQYKSTGKYFYEFYYPYTCILDEDDGVYMRAITHQESVSFEEKDNNTRNLE